ncbi:hypothetical protein BT63DRAFT_429779 [Microthyrium microscopicum]|uniref:Ribosomal protein bL31m N-terminal domain-containing protein n=1 Tax=Microthyrium microscopicum TaxID=703497 RepID=A0A6A6TX05_9PEZI|nr:hypothetical protein BT63DRAFT_429779 [Microthyrium microscopicum]
MSNALRPSTRRIQLPPSSIISHNLQQTRHATLIKRPKRPYTFTQLVTLTDGSSYLHRTTSPLPVYRPTKDQRSAPMWNPSDERLMNLEDDDAGKLKLFRSRFGRGYDLGNANAEEEVSHQHHLMCTNKLMKAG